MLNRQPGFAEMCGGLWVCWICERENLIDDGNSYEDDNYQS